MTPWRGNYASYLLLALDRLRMAVVVAVQRVASTFEEEINIILDGRDSKNTKHVIKTA